MVLCIGIFTSAELLYCNDFAIMTLETWDIAADPGWRERWYSQGRVGKSRRTEWRDVLQPTLSCIILLPSITAKSNHPSLPQFTYSHESSVFPGVTHDLIFWVFCLFILSVFWSYLPLTSIVFQRLIWEKGINSISSMSSRGIERVIPQICIFVCASDDDGWQNGDGLF